MGINKIIYIALVLLVAPLCSCKTIEPASALNGFKVEGYSIENVRIVIQDNSKPSINLASKELQKYLFKISGHWVDITNKTKTSDYNIILGLNNYSKFLEKEIPLQRDGYYIKSQSNKLFILGRDENYTPTTNYTKNRSKKEKKKFNLRWSHEINNKSWINPLYTRFKNYNSRFDLWSFEERGTLNGVYSYLKKLGVRWYSPGELGEHLPSLMEVKLGILDEKSFPSFLLREFNFSGKHFHNFSEEEILWYLRLGLSKNKNIISTSGHAHGLQFVIKNNPQTEVFSIVNGQRMSKDRSHGQPCLSSPLLFNETVEYCKTLFDKYDELTVSVMPTDSFDERCECQLGCKTQYQKGKRYLIGRKARGTHSNYVWNFVNNVAKELYKTHPDKKILCFAYTTYLLPPTNIDKLSPNLLVGICNNRPSLIYDPGADFFENLVLDWFRLANNQRIIFWDYNLHGQNRVKDNYANIPVIYTKEIDQKIKTLSEYSSGEFVEVFWPKDLSNSSNLTINHINLYVSSVLYWNPSENIDIILTEYYQKYFPRSNKKMKEFYSFCEQNWRKMPENKLLLIEAKNLLNSALATTKENTKENQRILDMLKFLSK